MKHLETLQRILWPIADHGRLCGVFIVSLAILFTIKVFADRLHSTTATRGRAAELAEAVQPLVAGGLFLDQNPPSMT